MKTRNVMCNKRMETCRWFILIHFQVEKMLRMIDKINKRSIAGKSIKIIKTFNRIHVSLNK